MEIDGQRARNGVMFGERGELRVETPPAMGCGYSSLGGAVGP